MENKIYQRNKVIVDIDRSISKLTKEREEILSHDIPNWDAFYKCDFSKDEPIDTMVKLVQTLQDNPFYEIIFCTSRSESVKEQTMRWLTDRFNPTFKLLMRGNEDERPAHIVKPELVIHSGIHVEEIAFALDDEDKVVQQWRRLGVQCLQVDYEFKPIKKKKKNPIGSEHDWAQFVRLGDMMGDGLHHEPDGKWITKEYNKLAEYLVPEIKDAKIKRNLLKKQSVNESMVKFLKDKKCTCGGRLVQKRSGARTAYCLSCDAKYTVRTRKKSDINN